MSWKLRHSWIHETFFSFPTGKEHVSIIPLKNNDLKYIWSGSFFYKIDVHSFVTLILVWKNRDHIDTNNKRIYLQECLIQKNSEIWVLREIFSFRSSCGDNRLSNNNLRLWSANFGAFFTVDDRGLLYHTKPERCSWKSPLQLLWLPCRSFYYFSHCSAC